jgi:hypothetical protein
MIDLTKEPPWWTTTIFSLALGLLGIVCGQTNVVILSGIMVFVSENRANMALNRESQEKEKEKVK